MSDQQWLIRVNGVDELRVDDGQTVVIGRKPLRPMTAEPGTQRLDVVDSTKSMSKRHARFSVASGGAARIADLGSTNGTYVIRDDGGLMRVPAQTAFLLPKSTMRFQFGDVPVDFLRVDRLPDDDSPVRDLFSYAPPDGEKQIAEPGLGSGLDDILDVRAGEPTSAFSSSQVRSRIEQMHDHAVQLRQDVEPQAVEQEDAASRPDAVVQDGDRPDVGQPASVEPVVDVNASSAVSAEPSLPLFGAGTGEDSSIVSGTDEASSDGAGRDLFLDAANAADTHYRDDADADDDAAAHPETDGDGAASTPEVADSPASDVSDAAMASHGVDDRDSSVGYTPVYEPGSVFERLTQGEADEAGPGIEVDGLSSEDAKTTRDYDVQFEMAKRRQLLPFLAMNPALYDDLYAWLEVQGDPDIDRALADNQGYQDYLAEK